MLGITANNVPEDVLLAIFSQVSVRDILKLRQVCRAFDSASRSRYLWWMLLQRDVRTKALATPNYCRPLDALTTSQIERLVTHALRLHYVLSAEPPATVVQSFYQAGSVTWVKLIQGQWLVAACSNRGTSVVRLWSLQSLSKHAEDIPEPVEEVFLEGPVVTGLLDVQDRTPILALEIRTASHTLVDIFSLYVSSNGRPHFSRLLRLQDDVSHIRCLQGSRFAFALHAGRGIPSVMDWRTGIVVNLRALPDKDGGAAAMAMDGDTVAVVIPVQLQVYNLQQCSGEPVSVTRTYSVALGCSVGWAQVIFIQSSSSSCKDTMRICICVAHIDPTPLHLAQGRQPHRFANWDPCLPIFATHGISLAWTVLPPDDSDWSQPFALATLPDGLLACRPNEGCAQRVEPTYILKRTDLPALYAAGVYDYDEALGLVVLGNAYGELATINLGALSITSLCDCFEPLPKAIEGFVGERMPREPIPSTSALLYPFFGPWAPSEEYSAPLSARWKAQQPDPVPPGWRRFEVTDNWHLACSSMEWTNVIPQPPYDYSDIGWDVEHAYHYLGALVPLLWNTWYVLFEAGGLLLLWLRDLCEMRVVSPGLTAREFVELCGEHGAILQPVLFEYDSVDATAGGWGRMLHGMWLWEGQATGRNRWQELKDRGGNVHSDWLAIPAKDEPKDYDKETENMCYMDEMTTLEPS